MADDAELVRRHRAGQRGFFVDTVTSGPGQRLVELPGGVLGAVTPSAPDRSYMNSVLYDDGDLLVEQLPALAALYAEAGVQAWTVWVRPEDGFVAHALAAAGHMFDGAPMIMGANLNEFDLDRDDGLELDPDPSWEAIGAVNDAAYGVDGAFARLLGPCPDLTTRRWMALAGGRPAATVAARIEDADVYVALVAVHPDFRRRGLSSALLRAALRGARGEGCETATLEATAMGEPVYTHMGYRPFGRLGMWERRVPAPSA